MLELLEKPAAVAVEVLPRVEKPEAPSRNATIGAALRQAADRLDKVGWCQDRSVNLLGNECAAQAIWMAVGGGVPMEEAIIVSAAVDLFQDTTATLRRFLKALSVPGWNDRPGRTAFEVTNALRKCADHIDPQ